MPLSAVDFIGVGNRLVSNLNLVINSKTDKSDVGCITEQEIKKVLLNSVPDILKILKSNGINVILDCEYFKVK